MKPIIEKYILYIALIVGSIVAFCYFVIPTVQEALTAQTQHKELQERVADLTKSVELSKKKQQKKDNPVEKKIYEPIEGTASNQSFDTMLETILEIAKESGLKIKTIDLDKTIESDPVKTNHASTHDVKLLSAQVIGTYTQLQTFLREVFRYQYLIGVKKIEITPYENDKKILIVNLDLSLYAKK